MLAAAVSLLVASAASAALPNWQAALGDSITRGFGSTGVDGSGDNFAGSWSAGTDGAVNSHYSRILGLNAGISGHQAIYATNGSKMSATLSQANSAVTLGAEYVTIMSGTNDVCSAAVHQTSQMTSVSTFTNNLVSTLNKLTSQLPSAKILLSSIPNWYGLWQAFQSNPSALSAWSTYSNRCPILLDSSATGAERSAVSQRIIDLNTAEQQTCALYPACTYDGGAVYNLSFASTDLTYDYFHFSISGQALLAATLWNAGPYATPTNTALPTISGLAQEGQTLSSTTGTWSDSPTYTYQWKRCDTNGNNCANIGSATASTYGVVSADVGSRLRVAVTASNSSGSATATSAATQIVTPPPPANTDLPTISGSAQDGQTLSSTTGTWTNSPTSFGYQWRRCDSGGANCANIGGATASTYQLASADIGSTVRVSVTATNAGGSTSAASNQTAVVVAAPPTNTAVPTISGTAQEGQTLTASPGTWTGAPTFSYQWLRCNTSGSSCSTVGADQSTYGVSAADIGSRMKVQVTATNGAGSNSASSSLTAVVTEAAPANTGLPQVSGTAQDGQTLSTTTGTWTGSPSFGYQWRRCNSSGTSCVNVSGATASSYVLTSADVGSTIRSRVTATNSGGSTMAESDPQTAVVLALPPTNSALPTVSGTAQEEQTLLATSGTWTGSPSFGYQWRRCDTNGNNCADIAGATASTYALVAADIGSRVRVQVTATNSGGSGVATSDPTATVIVAAPANTALPTISGTAQEGQTLSGDPGTWTHNPTYGYQWLRCNSSGASCSPISGETGTAYVVTTADIGSKLRIRVTGSNAGGSANADSNPTAVVVAIPPANTGLPVVTGTAVEFQTLSTTTGTWTGNNPSYSYQWQRCNSSGASCNPISGATTSSYQVAAADIGSTIRAAVTATNSGGANTATSNATAVVTQSPPVNHAPPTISGTTQEGQTLSSSAGSWTGGPTFTYQWLRCDGNGANCSAISGATASSYQLVPADIGSKIEVTVTGTNSGGSVPATSDPTAVVTPAPPQNTALPTISGTAQEGQVLSTTTGTWTGSPTSYTYQWRRCNSGGGSCANISGATNSTYTLTTNDVGSTMRVRVTASNAGGPNAVDSAQTGVVVALPPVNSGLPTISGTAQEAQTLTASTGTWTGETPTYAYQWLRCDGSGANCNAISGATSSTYDAVGADVDGRIKVTVTATNSGGSTPATSAATAVVIVAAPANTALPTIGGTAQEGQTLTAAAGTWTHNPSYGYQWLRCNSSGASCNPISGATNTTYQLGSGDIGSKIRIRVTGTNAGGSANADSNATAVVIAIPPANTALPAVSGTTVENQTLSTTNGTWSGNNPSYTYQWQRCNGSGTGCNPISGATASTYQLASADVGSTIRAAVIATNTGGSTTAVSDATPLITQAPPTNTSLPTITGPPQEGQTLSSAPGTWTGSPSFTYQWLRCDSSGNGCNAISGATASTYLLGQDDVDSTVKVTVTGTNSGGTASATSTATGVIKDPPLNTALPVVSGPPTEGQTLTTTNGSWSGDPTGFAYQWRRCNSSGGGCSSIGGATSSSYVPAGADVGSTIRAVVTATNAGGSTPATSDQTAVITAAAFAPAISSFSGSSGVPGSTVRIDGTRLYKASSVTFGGIAGQIVENTASVVKAIVPAAATSGPIAVTTQDGTASSLDSFVVDQPSAPKITSFQPTTGVPGTLVTISGSRLLGAMSVKFNGVEATITSNGTTSIKVLAPAGSTTGKVSVTTAGGTATSSGNFVPKPPPTPVISTFTPSSAYIGKTVTIKGTGLLGATSVKFNGVQAKISSNTASAIKAVIPTGADDGKISVTTAGGTAVSAANFNVTASPTPKITGFSPTEGVPGTVVTITGRALLAATSVKFGGVEGEITSNSASAINVLVPPGAPTGAVSVTTAGGTAVSTTIFSVL